LLCIPPRSVCAAWPFSILFVSPTRCWPFLALRALHSVLALGRLSRFTRVAAALCLRLARAMLLLAALAGLLFLSLRLVGPRLALTLVVLHSGLAFALPHLGPALILPGCWSFIAALLRVSAHFSALPRALFACA
jgi:hypothetical protein